MRGVVIWRCNGGRLGLATLGLYNLLEKWSSGERYGKAIVLSKSKNYKVLVRAYYGFYSKYIVLAVWVIMLHAW